MLRKLSLRTRRAGLRPPRQPNPFKPRLSQRQHAANDGSHGRGRGRTDPGPAVRRGDRHRCGRYQHRRPDHDPDQVDGRRAAAHQPRQYRRAKRPDHGRRQRARADRRADDASRARCSVTPPRPRPGTVELISGRYSTRPTSGAASSSQTQPVAPSAARRHTDRRARGERRPGPREAEQADRRSGRRQRPRGRRERHQERRHEQRQCRHERETPVSLGQRDPERAGQHDQPADARQHQRRCRRYQCRERRRDRRRGASRWADSQAVRAATARAATRAGRPWRRGRGATGRRRPATARARGGRGS